MNNTIPELELRQLLSLIDRLQARLFAVEPSEFSALARRENDDALALFEFLYNFRDTLLPWANVLASGSEQGFRFLSSRFMEWAYSKNQFFELESHQAKRLSRAHRLLFAELARALAEATSLHAFAIRGGRALCSYVERLARVFRLLNVGSPLARGSEYSAPLQLTILGLEGRKFLEPFVDLGAGKSGALVSHLRSSGVNATGLDRFAASPYVLEKDWFSVRFEPKSIGTIVSHLAFSLHFLHHHWNPGDKAYAYAQKYMELLAALKPGGLFVYAPGLPFIEPMLDEAQYRIERRPLPEPLAEKMANYRDLGTGQSVAYVTHIEKIR